MPKLGVNIDHIATLRQARRESDPDPVTAALICQKYGANSIVCHLREDRRHIQDQDVYRLKSALKINLTLEMGLNRNIIDLALKVKPHTICLVPEKRQEITTEGGLDLFKSTSKIKNAIKLFHQHQILVSLFIDPTLKQISLAKELNADVVEIHTGTYANQTGIQKQTAFKKIKTAVQYAHELGLTVNAGHGLKYHDTKRIAAIKHVHELNIGHSIISESVFTGLPTAVKRMKSLVKGI